MRGKVQTAFTFLIDTGITPAYAGKSAFLVAFSVSLKDHPRLCGEKAYCTPHQMFHQGSPPPMRGKVFSLDAALAGRRITPAYAGKSYNVKNVYRVKWDHPRLCGEKSLLVSRRPRFLGSPPPMRGKAAAPNDSLAA